MASKDLAKHSKQKGSKPKTYFYEKKQQFRESHLKKNVTFGGRLSVCRRPSWSSKIFVHSRRPNSRARPNARPLAALLRSEKRLKLNWIMNL